MNEIKELKEIIKTSKKIVFFGGAGVSTESGIPDFRSKDGLYNQKYDYNPEEILSHSFFVENPEYFYKFYFDKMIYDDIKPNECHKYLAKLENDKKLSCVITQNIDNLHELAGSKKVIHLHGEVAKNHCMSCNKFYSLEDLPRKGVPKCTCGGIIKPDVVLYEEPLDDESVIRAIKEISECDTLIIGGTSLSVYPAASYVNYFNGDNLIVINRDIIRNVRANLQINASISEVFEQLKD